MSQLHNNQEKTPSQNLQVWYCEHCQNVHFKTQNVMLDFSRREFADLTRVMLDIYQNHFDPLKLGQTADSAVFSDDILASEIVS